METPNKPFLQPQHTVGVELQRISLNNMDWAWSSPSLCVTLFCETPQKTTLSRCSRGHFILPWSQLKKMSEHKLTYFPLSARGFVTRVCMRASGKPFEDNRVDFPSWGALKATGFGPLGQLPVLEVDGVQYCQSIPLSAYAAKLAGLYPTDPLAALKAEEVVAILDELWNKIGATSKDKPETREAYGNEVAPKYLKALASRLGEGPFFHGATPGWADLWVYVFVTFFTSGFFDHVPTDFVAKAAPALTDLVQRIKDSDL